MHERMPGPGRLTPDPFGGLTWESGPGPERVGPVPGQEPAPVSRRRLRLLSEGPRGTATRVSLAARYAAYFLTVLVCSLITHAFLSSAGTTEYGGSLMWFSAMLMFFSAAVGCVMFPSHRRDIFPQMRHYVFGLSVFPGTAIAAIVWALRDIIASPNATSDALTSLLNFAVPAVFITTVVLPPVIFIKALAGYHSLHRSRMDDAEMMALYNRQDPLQR